MVKCLKLVNSSSEAITYQLEALLEKNNRLILWNNVTRSHCLHLVFISRLECFFYFILASLDYSIPDMSAFITSGNETIFFLFFSLFFLFFFKKKIFLRVKTKSFRSFKNSWYPPQKQFWRKKNKPSSDRLFRYFNFKFSWEFHEIIIFWNTI